MKLLQVDNPALYKGEKTRAITKGKKIVFLPPNSTIIVTRGFIPHIKNNENNIIYKYCHICKEWLSLNSFLKTKYNPDGYKDKCKYCDNKIRREKYARSKSVH